MDNIKAKNIDNLVSLWETVGKSFGKYFQEDDCSYCQIPHTEWPNRVWFNKKVKEKDIEKSVEIIRNSPIPLSVSCWDDKSKHSPVSQNFGLTIKSEQTGMSLPLNKKFDNPNRVRLVKAETENQARLWTEIFPKNFGYVISMKTLLKTQHLIPYSLIYLDETPIGTSIAYPTENVIGIHAMGIIPEYRKQGFAEEAMLHILNSAIDDNLYMAVLQSSTLGKGVYQKLGFTEDFVMTNYALETV